MGAKDLDEPFVLGTVLIQAFQLVAARTEGAGRGVAQRRYRLGRIAAGVDEVFGERPDDAVSACEHPTDPFGMRPRRLDHPGRSRVDHGGHAAGLRVERIFEHGKSNWNSDG